jgi:hypothetical protein
MIGINRHTLNSTSHLVFIIDMHCVFCDVGNDFVKIIHAKLRLQCITSPIVGETSGILLNSMYCSIFVAAINQSIILTTNSVGGTLLVAQLVEALRYKPEVHVFDSRSFRSHSGPGVDSASNIN